MTIDPGLTVYGSVVGLNQVLMNLISNAIDAMPKGGKLNIRGSENAGRVEISIEDTGQGISPEIKDRMFEPFFTTKMGGRGAGLGLYIVQREIEQHAGKIRVHSTPGVGSTFTIDLPKSEPISQPGNPMTKQAA